MLYLTLPTLAIHWKCSSSSLQANMTTPVVQYTMYPRWISGFINGVMIFEFEWEALMHTHVKLFCFFKSRKSKCIHVDNPGQMLKHDEVLKLYGNGLSTNILFPDPSNNWIALYDYEHFTDLKKLYNIVNH